ncbi:MAG: hypothetical protein LDL33_02590 [Desulfomonile sp.]|nr:hypothetical protein [Desulfomonile sp.]
MKRVLTFLTVSLVTLMFTALPALSDENPVVSLERVEVATIQPFFLQPKIMVPSKDDPNKKEEKPGGVGYSSTLNTAYIFNIKNPGKKPVMLDELQFTVAFDGIDVNTATLYEDSWIPAGKSNQVRVIASNEAHTTILSLSVGAENAQKLQNMKTNPAQITQKWWSEISDFSFPVTVTGTATFQDEKGKTIRVPFSGKFGGQAAGEKK